ncbi:trehalose operon repressor [Clostridium perfringens]|uniref:trehalose operon repressor n=1 Tax=Clostridium perfringens TaxID=1502 RepID=UPI000B144489|nr:trehalose operon repressor [Clostridium perfringens]EIL8447414.1 trehalose operon repressor [Clostridium perfringens]EJT6501103.1 trehalose operon repressor [Clostridium perfringens]ELC8348696.1 trehalose operon repressor [Clostridium perfringens]ELC8439445.1 trehalose operon repressor [Clostridium perfringens]MBI6020532.1 trehalose operon repressor [Clostridium perfringens]
MSSKYLKIYNDIVGKIDSGIFEANTKLPSESQLMDEYNVSRDTVRKSLNLLEQNGYIEKSKGKGSFVLDMNKFDFPVSGIKSFKEIENSLGKECETILEELTLKSPSDSLMKKLEVSPNKYIWSVVRVRNIDGEKIILDKDYLNSEFVPRLTEEICKDSLYKYIEEELGLKIAYAEKEITVQTATEEDQRLLDLRGYDMVAVVKSYTYLEGRKLFQYTESRHRPDKFKFVDFARR